MGHRRTNGEGTLFRRKDGRWAAQAYVKLPNGTTKRICITNRDQKVVKNKLRDVLEQAHRNMPYAEKDWTVGDYLDYWMEEVQRHRLSDNTMSLYSRAIRNHLKPTLGRHKLKELSVRDVRYAIATLKNQNCGIVAIQKSLQALSSCLSCAMREELVFRNVAHLVEKPQYTPKETEIWTKEQATHFLRVVRLHPQYLAFLLLFTYGMRRSEVLGLRYSDIDFENKRIHLRQQISRIEGVVAARPLKTKNSRRTLPLVDIVEHAVLEHAERQGVRIPPFNPCHEFSTEGTMIVSGTGKPLESVYLPQLFHQLSAKAGLPRIKLHAIRHTTATILKDLDIPPKDVQLMLGHADISTTMNIYQHGTPETHRVAIATVGERLLAAY